MIPEYSDRWFADEVQLHQDALRAWLRGRFPAIEDPENIVQESITRVWRVCRRDQVQSPKSLLFTTAQNLALDQLRRRQIAHFETLTEIDGPSVPEDRPTPADNTARNQELEILTQAIQSLPERCRQVLTLRKIYGMPQKQIAAQLGIAEHTVEAQVAIGMRRCTDFLARFGLP